MSSNSNENKLEFPEISSNTKTETGNSITPEETKRVKKIVIKNLLVIGISWLLLFTSYMSIANLQSSLNTDASLGTVNLSIIYIALIISSLFLPTIMIKKLGVKWTILICQITYILYVAANIYPRYWTMIPAAIVLGSAPLWTAQSAFLADLATFYSKYSKEKTEIVINRFFGIFFALFQTSGILGNAIISTVLKPQSIQNSTNITSLSYCGSNDCPGSSSAKIRKPDQTSVFILCGVYVGISILAALIIFFFLDKYRSIGMPKTRIKNKNVLQLLINTIKNLKNPNQLLIIPMSLWSGFEQGFFSADFTKSYISCVKGVEFVGYVLIAYAVTATLASSLFGYVVKFIGRIACFVIAAILSYLALVVLLFWKPSLETSYLLFIISVIWGLADTSWVTQINSFYGLIFKRNEEAGFSNHKLWQSLGFAIAYAYSNYICVNIKIYLLIGYLTVAMLGYFAIEVRIRYRSTN